MSLANRSLALAFGAFGLVGLVPAQDLTLVYKETPGGNTTAQYVTKDRMRRNSPDQDSIFEYATGKITNIDHKKKEYYEVTLDEMEAPHEAGRSRVGQGERADEAAAREHAPGHARED